MSWSAEFIQRLSPAYTYAPKMILETVAAPTEIGHGGWRIVTHEDLSGRPLIGSGGRMSIGSEVTPRTWQSTAGAWSVPLVGDIRNLLSGLYRGQLVRLRVGFAGWPETAFEPVALGQVWGLRGQPGQWWLDIRSITAALQSRITSTEDEYSLFHDLADSTTLSADYTAGDLTLDVADSTGLEAKETQSSGTQYGALYIEPSSGKDPFVLLWSAVAGDQYTVLATGALGTTPVDAKSGSTVTELGYISAHPSDLVRRVLTSTGTAGAGGDYDSLPAAWSYGLSDSLIDHFDLARWRAYLSPTGGIKTWEAVAYEAQESGLAWLSGLLQRAGMWITTRQGQLTVRGCLNPRGSAYSSSTGIPHIEPLTDAEIISVDSWEAWDAAYGVEYRTHRVATASSSADATERVSSLPVLNRVRSDFRSIIYDDQAAWRNHLTARLSPWVLRIPERLTLTLAGLHRAGLTTGDQVPITSSLIGGRLEAIRNQATYEGRIGQVARVAPDWWGGTTALTLAILPDSSNEFA